MLRAKGIAARVRCGFGSYFNPGYFEDHVVCEIGMLPSDAGCWPTRNLTKPGGRPSKSITTFWTCRASLYDRSRCLVLCRAGEAGPQTFRIFKGDLRGPLVHREKPGARPSVLQYDGRSS